jgi:hypothetical protein
MTGGWGKEIEAVEVERQTDNSVWIDGRRIKKMSNWKKYHDTWVKAWEYLLSVAQGRVEGAEIQLVSAEEYLKKIEGLREAES